MSIDDDQQNPPEWDYRVPVCAACRVQFKGQIRDRDVDIGELVVERCSGCRMYREDTRRCSMPFSLYAQCNRCGTVYTSTLGRYVYCPCTPSGTLCENRGVSRIVGSRTLEETGCP